MLKKILLILLVLSMLVSTSVCLFSCDGGNETNGGEGENEGSNETNGENGEGEGENDGQVTYTIIVKDSDGNPVSGTMVQICVAGEGGACYPIMQRTDAEGKTSVTRDADNFKAKILSITSGYSEVEAGAYHDFDENNIATIVVTKNAE